MPEVNCPEKQIDESKQALAAMINRLVDEMGDCPCCMEEEHTLRLMSAATDLLEAEQC